MLLPVITRVAAETGIPLVQDRQILLDLWNGACRIFHQELECNKIYREVTLIVPPDKVIALPSYIGEVKGLRVHTTEMLIPLQSINVPRYSNSTLLYKIKNWRDLGDSPVQQNLVIVGPLTLTVPKLETVFPTIKVKGQTSTGYAVEEEVLMNSLTKTTVNSFGPRMDNIASFSVRQYDLIVTDGAGNILAMLNNTQQKTRYKLMDVSEIFWPMNDTVDGKSFIDVCYKIPFAVSVNDTDSFIGTDDYDEAIRHMMLHLNFMTQGGKEAQASAELIRATMLLKSVKDGTEDGIKKKLNFGRNRFYSLFSRGRHRMSGNDYGMFFADLTDY